MLKKETGKAFSKDNDAIIGKAEVWNESISKYKVLDCRNATAVLVRNAGTNCW